MNNLKNLPTNSFKDLCELCATILNGETKNHNSLYQSYKSPGSFWYNRNFIETSEPGKIKESVDLIKEDLKNGNPFIITYTKFMTDNSADNLLLQENYPLFADQTGMNFDLKSDLVDVDDENLITIDEDKIEEWSKTVSTAFGKPEDLGTFKALIKSGQCVFYAYLDNGKIVGTALVYTKDGNSGIHEVSVLPEYRGKSIAKKLILKSLYDAKVDGADYSSLQASALGEPLYKSIGFETVSIISTYISPPPK